MIHFCYYINSQLNEITPLACQSKVAALVEEPNTFFDLLWCLKIKQRSRPAPDVEFVAPIGQIIWLIRKHFQEGLPLISTSLK